MIDFIAHWSRKTDTPAREFVAWLGLNPSTYFSWKKRYGQVNHHNGAIPRDHWLEDWEREAILDFHRQYPGEGYRRITYMMLDRNIVAVSPASVYRVLKRAGLLRKWHQSSRKGTGFTQPTRAHAHWHVDITYINIKGTFFYLVSILDGYSRAILHHEIHSSMTQQQVQIAVERAREKYLGKKKGGRTRVISDNGPQFIARDFKSYVRQMGMDHVLTAPYYPESNGKIERYHKTLKQECIRPKTPLSLEDARRIVGEFVTFYNEVRLHSAIGYVAPMDRLLGREKKIFAERDARLEAARDRRAATRQKHRQQQGQTIKEQTTENSDSR